jgi:hypothetical protein
MILIRKGESNNICLTLKEKCELDNPIFLFRFVDDVDKTEYACIVEDISIYKDRYNEFIFIEGTTATLVNRGFYHYYIYEQESENNLDYTLANLVESGKLMVVGETTVPTTAFESTEQFKSFN